MSLSRRIFTLFFLGYRGYSRFRSEPIQLCDNRTGNSWNNIETRSSLWTRMAALCQLQSPGWETLTFKMLSCRAPTLNNPKILDQHQILFTLSLICILIALLTTEMTTNHFLLQYIARPLLTIRSSLIAVSVWDDHNKLQRSNIMSDLQDQTTTWIYKCLCDPLLEIVWSDYYRGEIKYFRFCGLKLHGLEA